MIEHVNNNCLFHDTCVHKRLQTIRDNNVRSIPENVTKSCKFMRNFKRVVMSRKYSENIVSLSIPQIDDRKAIGLK